jgi:hypothetical protein
MKWSKGRGLHEVFAEGVPVHTVWKTLHLLTSFKLIFFLSKLYDLSALR